MMLATVGGDMRYAYLTKLAAAQSMEISSVGMENCPMKLPCIPLEDLKRADAVILPNPWRQGMVLPFAESVFTLEDVVSCLRPGTPVLLSDAAGKPENADINAIDLSENPRYILKNAHLTAEAALSCAAGQMHRAFLDSRCLVIGYGRIGRRLSCLLRAMGADVFAAARREETRGLARNDGVISVSPAQLAEVLPGMDCIFTTVPARILTTELLRLISRDALLMDLASPPYGFDLDEAASLSLRASRENGLPGRVCPLSAAAALLEAAREAICEQLKGGIPCLAPAVI